MVRKEKYPPPNRSITPEESTFAGEAVGRGEGAANASTAVSTGNIIFSISKATMIAKYFKAMWALSERIMGYINSGNGLQNCKVSHTATEH